ncbi:MAG: dihydrolipoamide acetyltransferase family protein [Haloplanus sp.]
MAYIVRMPKLGLEMSQGTLLDWHVDEGDDVADGDVIATIESEKTQADVEAREAGVLRRRYLPEGETCEPGDPIGIVAEPEVDIADLEAAVEGEGGEAASTEPGAATNAEPEQATREATAKASEAGGSGDGAVKASPPARKRAQELGVDLATVEGTGPGGAVTPDDVERAASGGAEGEREPEAPTAESGSGAGPTLREERSLSRTRRTIAERLGESYRNAVHVTERRTVDAEELVTAAEAADDALDADVAVTDVLLLALSETLDEHPTFNAHYEDDSHRLYEEHNVCVAVDTEQGLIAPVIRDVSAKSLGRVASERHEVTHRVLSDEHTMDDLTGGTFTVTNLGPFGVESFSPIINPPQVAILGINAIAKQAVPGADDAVEVRRQLPLNLSFDHRVVDGADAARFLGTLADHLEAPWALVPDEVTPPGERL